MVSWLGLEPRTLALKARKDQNSNGLILRRFLLPRKDVKYEFVVWQNSTILPRPGDLVVDIQGAT